jgi:signal transduction histidine kinase
MATAIANTESHAGAARLADEQASLRRVALLIATEASLEEVFGKVAEEVGQVLGDVDFALVRDDGGGSATTVAVSGGSVSAVFRPGVRMALDQRGVVGRVISEGRSCRIDDYAAATENVAEAARERGVGAAVGCPIEVGGRTWGVMVVARREREPFPPETETRIAQFSEVVATGIANSESREALRQLADEQAALRRVATLVAEGAAPDAVFDAVAEEMKRLLDADRLNLCRYEREGEMTVMAHRGTNAWRLPPGTRMSYDGESVTAMVRNTGTPARMDTYEGARGALAEVVRLMGTRSAIGAPVVVAGRVWGVMAASWNGDLSPPAGTEERMAQFAALLDTAIANADSRALLAASRVRLLTASDDARRRVVRDLHDGAQQRLMHTIVTLKLAQRALEQQDGSARALVDEALENAEFGTEEIRELARGILPTALTRGGLQPAIDSVVERLDLPVEADVPAKRFPAEIEASAYFIVAEALTNVVKHARARRAAIKASVQQGLLQIEVRDDGIGGADPEGHGVVGISDRAAALGGRLTIESPADGGTVVTATLPLSVGESAPHFRLAQDQQWRTG